MSNCSSAHLYEKLLLLSSTLDIRTVSHVPTEPQALQLSRGAASAEARCLDSEEWKDDVHVAPPHGHPFASASLRVRYLDADARVLAARQHRPPRAVQRRAAQRAQHNLRSNGARVLLLRSLLRRGRFVALDRGNILLHRRRRSVFLLRRAALRLRAPARGARRDCESAARAARRGLARRAPTRVGGLCFEGGERRGGALVPQRVRNAARRLSQCSAESSKMC